MSTTYNGVAANVTARANPSTTNPADGDGLTAASVNAALQVLTDQAAFFQSRAVLSGASPNNNTGVTITPSSGVALTLTPASGSNGLQVNNAAGGNNAGVSVLGTGTGDAGIFTGGSSGGRGLLVTGGGSANGIDSTGGSGGGTGVTGTAGSSAAPGIRAFGSNVSGARGSLSINSQASAGSTGLLAGDFLWDGTNLRFCKTNGSSVIVV